MYVLGRLIRCTSVCSNLTALKIMGCGASKSTQVASTEITIKDQEKSNEMEPQPATVTRAEPSQGVNVYEERSQDTLSVESTSDQNPHREKGPENEVRPKYEAFEVSISGDGITNPRGPPPRRLSKLDSVPKLTTEMLAEKQRQVEERKRQELERKARGRSSRKDRLRKQIVEARELEMAQQQYIQLEKKHSVNSQNKAHLQAEAVERHRKREEHAKQVRERALDRSTGELDTESASGSYDPSVEMDADPNYNTEEQNGFWESQSSEAANSGNDKSLNNGDRLEQYI